MHSRIFQISTAPVLIEDYMRECDFYEHWFVGSIADYVAGEIDRDHEIDYFRESLIKSKVAIFHDADSFSIVSGGKEAYFGYSYEQFNKAVNKAASVNLEDFANEGKCSSLVYTIKNSFCERFGPYVSSEDLGTIPLDEFIRNAEPGMRYYIGNVLDYHW